MSEPDANGSRFRIPAIKWHTLVTVLLTAGLAFQFWLTYRNVTEWEWNRLAQAGVSARVAEDRTTIAANNTRILNELKLQTFNQMLPLGDQQRLLPTLLSRLDEETRRNVLSLKLRALQVIGEQQGLHVEQRGSRVEQQGGYVEQQRSRSQAP